MRPLPQNVNARGSRGHDTSFQHTTSNNLSCFITTEAALQSDEDAESSSPTLPPQSSRPDLTVPKIVPSPTTANGPSSASGPHNHRPPSLLSEDALLRESLSHVMNRIERSYASASASAISSFSSRRNSLTVSSCDDDRSAVESLRSVPSSNHIALSQSIPDTTADGPESQFILPSLTVPPRRKFTNTGRAIGKLKILVTGPQDVGKTSLVESLTRRCEHIVHVDSSSTPVGRCRETHASTKPRPRWQHGSMHRPLVERRASSLTTQDEVLDRNLCFVDSLGDRVGSQPPDAARYYIEAQLSSLHNKATEPLDLLALIASGSWPIVDVVLYLLPNSGAWDEDMTAIRHLQQLTSVIPLISRSDELTQDQLSSLRQRLSKCVEFESLQCISFANPKDPFEALEVSNATIPDHETLDASTLMNSEYRAPLAPSGLERLVATLISPDGSAWLRQTTATKVMTWWKSNTTSRISQSLITRQQMSPYLRQRSPAWPHDIFAANDWWQRVEVADWAHSLRRSLDAERARAQFGVPSSALEVAPRDRSGGVIEGKRRALSRHVDQNQPLVHQDPLGLLDLASVMRSKGQPVIELISSLGVAGLVTACVLQMRTILESDL